MSVVLLDLVRERVASGLDQARGSPLLSHLGIWLGVFEYSDPWETPDGLRQYKRVAEAAMVCASKRDLSAKQYFGEGVRWLQRRRFFVQGRPRSLEDDPIACVALSAGIQAYGNENAKHWLMGIVSQAISREHDIQRTDLFKLARAVANADDTSWGDLSPILAVACAHRLNRRPSPKQLQHALKAILSPQGPDVEWAVFFEAALQAIFAAQAAIDLKQPTIGQVTELLIGIPAALKRWPWEATARTQHRDVSRQRWDIQHEYHVQSLVWAILRPVFPFLEDEENLPSLGHKHPRADLLVPALRLVIEVKYLRQPTQAARANVIEEIAADSAIYRTRGSGFDTIIALIWDATRSTHHHAEIEMGLRKLEGVIDVVIVSRPGEWK